MVSWSEGKAGKNSQAKFSHLSLVLDDFKMMGSRQVSVTVSLEQHETGESSLRFGSRWLGPAADVLQTFISVTTLLAECERVP